MRKILAIAALAAATTMGVFAGAGSASATVSATHVDKGDVQRVLGWNNADFDKGSVAFTANVTATYDNTLTCRSGQVTQVPVVSTGTGTITATEVKSSNGKQITGWDLTGAAAGAVGPNDTTQIVAHFWTACDDGSIPTGVYVDPTPTVTFDGLRVNGIALPNTPVV